MQDINYVNPQINNIKNQELSIQAGLNGFSFLIKASSSEKYLVFKQYNFKNTLLVDELIRKVEALVSKESFFSTSYSSAKLFFISQKATLVPEAFFSPEYLKKYFEFSHSMDELDELHYTYIESLKAYSVFSIPNYLTGIFYTLLPQIKFEHQGTTLIKYGLNSANKGQSAILGINKTFFDIEIFENKELVLSNSFQYTNAMDFIYFVMYACKQLKIDLKTLQVQVLGDIKNHRKIISELRKHISNVSTPELSLHTLGMNISNEDALGSYPLFLSE